MQRKRERETHSGDRDVERAEASGGERGRKGGRERYEHSYLSTLLPFGERQKSVRETHRQRESDTQNNCRERDQRLTFEVSVFSVTHTQTDRQTDRVRERETGIPGICALMMMRAEKICALLTLRV